MGMPKRQLDWNGTVVCHMNECVRSTYTWQYGLDSLVYICMSEVMIRRRLVLFCITINHDMCCAVLYDLNSTYFFTYLLVNTYIYI